MPWSRLICLVIVVVFGILPPVRAEEKDSVVTKQKAVAQAKLSSAKVKAVAHETENLLVYATLPEEKVKSLAGTMQRSHGVASKLLKYDDKETPWTGKLTIFVITGSRPYKSFVLDALKRIPDARETSSMELRGDAPYLILGSENEKPSDSQLALSGSHEIAATLLSRKAGVGSSAIAFGLPDWLRNGFGSAMTLRTDATGNRLADHKSRVRSLLNRTRGAAFTSAAVWGEATNPQSELLSTSLVEYLAYGPEASKFPAILAGFKPQDDNTTPTMASVLAALEWKVEDLEVGWRSWVLKGK